MTDAPDDQPDAENLGSSAQTRVGICLDPDPSQAVRARELACKALATWGLAEYADDVELIVGELVANAIVHGSGPITVHLAYARQELRIDVHDNHPGRPVRRHATVDDEAGRGLGLVDGLIGLYGGMRSDTADSTGPGKTVHVTLPLRHHLVVDGCLQVDRQSIPPAERCSHRSSAKEVTCHDRDWRCYRAGGDSGWPNRGTSRLRPQTHDRWLRSRKPFSGSAPATFPAWVIRAPAGHR